jgi:hypothetical protein
MRALADVVARYHTEWDDPCVDRAIFGTIDPVAIASALAAFTKRVLGAEIHDTLLYTSSVGTAVGVELSDGRRILIKAHRPELALAKIRAFAAFRVAARRAGVAAPELLATEQLALGYASVEAFVDAPSVGDGFDPAIRTILAGGLWELARVGKAYADRSGLPRAVLPREQSAWRTPHSEIFDLARTAEGAEWLEELGRRAPLTALAGGSEFPAHTDWRVEHVRVANGKIVAVFDWDSIALTDEARMVGTSAAHYASNWESGFVGRRFPTPQESDAFVADYERARGRAFTSEERSRIGIVRTHELAYVARLGHAPGQAPMPGGAAEMLLQFGDAYFDVKT